MVNTKHESGVAPLTLRAATGPYSESGVCTAGEPNSECLDGNAGVRVWLRSQTAINYAL